MSVTDLATSQVPAEVFMVEFMESTTLLVTMLLNLNLHNLMNQG